MSLPSQSLPDPSSVQPRVPKLKVRRRFDVDDDEIAPVSRSSASPSSSISPQPAAAEWSDFPEILASGQSTPGYSSFGGRDADTFSETTGQTTKERKKRSSFMSFLTLKEPSTSAWQEFANQQKKQAVLRNPVTSKALVLPTKQLPATVPKVNSKWDGLPKVAHKHGGKRSMDMESFRGRSSGRSGTSSQDDDFTTTGRSSISHTGQQPATPMSETTTRGSSETIVTVRPERPAQLAMSVRSISYPPDDARSVHDDNASSSLSSTPGPYEPLLDQDQVTEAVPEYFSLFPIDHVPQDLQPQELITTRPAPAEGRGAAGHDGSAEQLQDKDDEDNSLHHPDTPSPSSPLTPSEIVFPLPPTGLPLPPKSAPPRQFKSAEEIPQWPLPTRPEDVVLANNESPPCVSREAAQNISSHSSPELLHVIDGFDFQLDGPAVSGNMTPTTPGRSRSPMSTPPRTTSNSPNRSQSASYLLRKPSQQPGRAVVKDSDLETIPESDTASVLFQSPDTGVSERVSTTESRASSDMSLQWRSSPRERLGLGSIVKHTPGAAPWPVPAQKDVSYVAATDRNHINPSTQDGDRGTKKGRRGGIFRR